MSPELRGQRRSPQFADLLRQHRIASALSQEALAERAGISARAVSDLERGVKQRPHLETVRMLADALGLTGTERATLAVASRPASTPSGAAVSRSVSRIGPVRNLPFVATEMVGRSDAAKAAASLILDERVRLLTLTGPGGVGKTRLALAVAGELSETFPDGVTWIELAPISDPHLVPDVLVGVAEEERRRLPLVRRAELVDLHLAVHRHDVELVVAKRKVVDDVGDTDADDARANLDVGGAARRRRARRPPRLPSAPPLVPSPT